ncbi:MAG TPA: hypothetical protein VFY26_01795 [Anaerolineales bacterium]|nr:hypothetical protein [Anaerolineales bacterium]
MSQLNLSARTYHRILKFAPTIADLAGSAESGEVYGCAPAFIGLSYILDNAE